MKTVLIHGILETSKGKEMKLDVMARHEDCYHFISQYIIQDRDYSCVCMCVCVIVIKKYFKK